MRNYRNYTEEDLIEAVKNSQSISGVCKLIGIKAVGGNLATIKRRIAQLNLDTSHFTFQAWSRGKTLKDWANYVKPSSLKKILLKERGNKCECCDLTEWMGQPILIELHHDDGNNLNNKKENLKLLCGNCHALTNNFRNRKRGVVELADTADLEDNLSDSCESKGLEPVKFGETLTSNVDGNTEPSPKRKRREGVETRRREPKTCHSGYG